MQQGHQRVGIGELGDGARGHEARRLDLTQTGRDEERDEPRLRLGRDGRGLVLEAVAGAHLVDPDAARECRSRDQPRGGSIARSIRATSTSIRPIRSMAARCSSLPCGAAFRRLRVVRWSSSSSSRVPGSFGSLLTVARRATPWRSRACPCATWPFGSLTPLFVRERSAAVRARRRRGPVRGSPGRRPRSGALPGARRWARPRRAPSSSPPGSQPPRPAATASPSATSTARTDPGHRGDELHGPAGMRGRRACRPRHIRRCRNPERHAQACRRRHGPCRRRRRRGTEASGGSPAGRSAAGLRPRGGWWAPR